MPSSMTHLIAARRIRPEGGALYYIGNIAPDAVDEWHKKDASHFRDLADREPALVKLAKATRGEFAEGVLLHLYVDWKWDALVKRKFIEKTGDGWFLPYRRELSLAGSHAFHSSDWIKQVWLDMIAADSGGYGATPYASVEDVREYIKSTYKWHTENNIGPSAAFPPEMIGEFVDQTADEYACWRELI